jgi:hypothetical protein
MIMSMASEEELAKSGLSRSIDTTIIFKNILDTAEGITADQKRLLKDGTLKLNVNMQESVLKADINFPYQNFTDLQELMKGATTGSMGDIIKKAMSKDSTKQAPAQSTGLDQVNSIFDVTVNNKLVSRKLNMIR